MPGRLVDRTTYRQRYEAEVQRDGVPFFPVAAQKDMVGMAIVTVGVFVCAALFGPRDLSFSITIVFGRFDGPGYDEAVALARDSAEYREVGSGEAFRHRARFYPGDALKLRELFERVSGHKTTEVLIDDRAIPYARELWLPLVWFLIPR